MQDCVLIRMEMVLGQRSMIAMIMMHHYLQMQQMLLVMRLITIVMAILTRDLLIIATS